MQGNKSILIVEDDALVALGSQQILEKSGYSVAGMFASGEEVLDYLGKNSLPDLIIMDIGLIGLIDGIQTARYMLQRYRIPIIFLTSYSDTKTMAEANKVPHSGYLTKPVVERFLLESVGTALASR